VSAFLVIRTCVTDCQQHWLLIFVKGGAVYLFNKRVMRFFRKDGHNWRKKKDGRTVAEAHERLKVRQKSFCCYYYYY
jgi:hypothetical protein